MSRIGRLMGKCFTDTIMVRFRRKAVRCTVKRKNALRCRGVDEHLRVGRDDQLAVLLPNEGT